jgi:pilus assembly protein Flp/PilA
MVPFGRYPFKEYSDLPAHAVHMKTIRRFLADESGATAIEYGLIAAGISVVIITVVNGIGTRMVTKFGTISTALK